MRRLAGGLCLALTLVTAVGCGSVIPLPVPATPMAVDPKLAPRPGPPPSEVVEVEEAVGFCSHGDFGRVAMFHGHYNASDAAHYHGWQPPMGEVYWVRC